MQPQKLPLDLTPPDPIETQDNLTLQVISLSLSLSLSLSPYLSDVKISCSMYVCILLQSTYDDASDDGDSNSTADLTANRDQVTPNKRSTEDDKVATQVMHK